MKNADNIKPRGVFTLNVFKNGELIEQYTDNNLVVDSGRNAAAECIGGTNQANNVIDTIAFGTNGATPAGGDTTITGAFEKTVDGITYPSTGAAAVAFTLDNSENNGMDIAEFGLKTVGGTLFSRKTRAVITKTVDIRLEGTWTIYF